MPRPFKGWEMGRNHTGSEPRVLLVAGGTGGHLFPGISVAQALMEHGVFPTVVITGKDMEISSVIIHGLSYKTFTVRKIMGQGLWERLKGIFQIPVSVLTAVSMLKELRPHLVLSMGAYLAGPICVAARFLGIPIMIHEQNSFPGITNRLCARLCQVAFISFEESRAYLRARSVILTGNPIRKELLLSSQLAKYPNDYNSVLVLGGSQGARFLNQLMSQTFVVLRSRGLVLKIYHQTGPQDLESVLAHYEKNSIDAHVFAFRPDMGEVYQRVTMAVARAGAGTIYELAQFGIPSVLIPYPHAANRHQHLNAQAMVRAGAALMFDQEEINPPMMAEVIQNMLNDRERLLRMHLNAKAFSKPNAAAQIAEEVLYLLKRKGVLN